jgi:anti-sigma factor RsiW
MDSIHVHILLQGYIDGELDLVKALEVEEHLKTCQSCTRKFQELLEVQTAVVGNSAMLYHPAPPALGKHVMSTIRKANQPSKPWLSFQWWQVAAVLGVVIILLFTGITAGWFAPGQNNQLALDVQAAHVRSMQANHLMDIISTDQHTVKPWFDGKLDFSPPVVDLSTQGYPLIGGRLDYLDGRQVAALVYMRNKHIINLFIWPTTAKPDGLHSSTDNGYRLVHWNQSEMTYWAVSDLNMAELNTFITLVQKNFQ